MRVTARETTADDIETLVDLYRRLEKEMTVLHSMWPVADGLDEPVEAAFEDAIGDHDSWC
jgi:hypothetical protein